MKANFYELTFEELTNLMLEYGLERFRSKQIFHWIYNKKATSFSEITTLKKEIRYFFDKEIGLNLPQLIKKDKQEDGTEKLLLLLNDKQTIESVIIPAGRKTTLCVSSQIGCALGCTFCATGKMGFIRNLTTDEIIGQILIALFMIEHSRRLTNIVFMGMGEPLNNLDNIVKAIKIIKNEYGLNFSGKRITISTAGIVPKIYELSHKNLNVKLAISLNAANNKKRTQIMPINKKYPIKELISAVRAFQKTTKWRITFEYVLLDGFNNNYKDAKELISLLGGISCKVNLIPYNSISWSKFTAPSMNKVQEFANWLYPYLPAVTIRQTRGDKIAGACGQLATKYNYD
ncbi:MAG: 23S rRNA (adenine(2503)-C(2))-methyltransferase RlmN [Candidatus Cloacimonadota bacterium]|nr:MAG: 23S rRNA (adenine(2503)-C(2))-methyltransferase RlmN [Candidatus Cloacimonadota bacterium]